MITDYSKDYYTLDEWHRQRLWVVVRPDNFTPLRGTSYHLSLGPAITFGFSYVKPIKDDRAVFRFFPPEQKEYIHKRYRAWWLLVADSPGFRRFWPQRLKYKEMILHDPRERLLHS